MMNLHNIATTTVVPWRRYMVIVSTIAVLMFGAWWYAVSIPPAVVSAVVEEAALTSYDYPEWIPELPVRLVIPTLGVDAAIQYVGIVKDGSGEMDVPSNFTDVGWYEPGVRPGMKGSAVITGHLNGKDVPEAVFFDLHTLDVGDEIVIMSAERIEDIFVVVAVKVFDYDAPTGEVFVSSDGKARLNLITCGGEWLADVGVYDRRTVVFTEQLTDVE